VADEQKQSLIIVEDDLDVADMLYAYFSVQGYDVLTANWGEEAVEACLKNSPDLVILDIRLPDIDGFEVARRLRHNRRTQNIPIIFLTEKRSRIDRLTGLELGGDDYLTKPFDIQELRLRVRNALSRSKLGTVNNPVTNLPEGPLVDERLTECLSRDGWGILLVTLQNLESFREVYGFVASDDVLRAVSLMINNAVENLGNKGDFIGQFSPTEFVIISKHEIIGALHDRIKTRLEESLDYFYPLKDRGRKDLQQKTMAVQLRKLSFKAGSFTGLDHLKANLLKS
jgi:PleD family two-component response regulator